MDTEMNYSDARAHATIGGRPFKLMECYPAEGIFETLKDNNRCLTAEADKINIAMEHDSKSADGVSRGVDGCEIVKSVMTEKKRKSKTKGAPPGMPAAALQSSAPAS